MVGKGQGYPLDRTVIRPGWSPPVHEATGGHAVRTIRPMIIWWWFFVGMKKPASKLLLGRLFHCCSVRSTTASLSDIRFPERYQAFVVTIFPRKDGLYCRPVDIPLMVSEREVVIVLAVLAVCCLWRLSLCWLCCRLGRGLCRCSG